MRTMWVWCEEQEHSASLLDASRCFEVDADEGGCPYCPVCKRDVHAQEAPGEGIPPPQFISLVQRLEAQTKV